jgi:(E)-2-((N-methylformamido)methylene)succinate hydrolase
MTRPVAVLLHGVGLDHSVWDEVRTRLAERYDVRTPDLPGHGDGPRVPADVDLAGMAALVADQVPPASHLVGFSLGALVAQHLAVHRPDLVSSLTSVSSVCRRTTDERAAVLERLDRATTDPAASNEASLRRWFDGADVGADAVERTRRVLAANDPGQFLACYRVFATGDAVVGPDLGRIQVPSLAVTGGEDPGSTPEMTERLVAAVPGCRAVVVPGVRHMLPLEAPSVLADLVDQLIRGAVHV